MSEIRVSFPVTRITLATAMALAARDHEPFRDLPDGNHFEDEVPEFAEYVAGMSKTRALRELRDCYRAYGLHGWPHDYPSGAYRVARERARQWLESGAIA